MSTRLRPLFPFAWMALAAGALLGSVSSAWAGAVYRCTGPNGQVAFTNRIGTFTHCTAVASYAEPPAARAGEREAREPRIEYRAQPAEAGSPALPPPASRGADVEVRRGAVYKVAKANGVTEYTNIRPRDGAAYTVLFTYMATCYACNVHSSVDWRNIPLNLEAFRDEIAAAAAEFGLDPALLRAVIHAESAFNPNAVSLKGAQGLMQLMPDTAADLGVANPFDARQNIRGGAQYLAQLLKEFDGDERLAAAAYDAGPQNVQKYNGVPPFDETRVYVERVATLRRRYREASPAALVAGASLPRS